MSRLPTREPTQRPSGACDIIARCNVACMELGSLSPSPTELLLMLHFDHESPLSFAPDCSRMDDPTWEVSEEATVERSVVSVGSTQIEIVTMVVIMPSHQHIAAFRRPPAQPSSGVNKAQKTSSLHDIDDAVSAHADPPGACLAVVQLCGKVGSIGSLPPSGPYHQFTAEDERSLSVVGRAFGVLLPAIRERERHEALALEAQAEADASQRQRTILESFTRVGGGANTVEELFPLARSLAPAVPAVTCHLFLIDEISMTPGQTPTAGGQHADHSPAPSPALSPLQKSKTSLKGSGSAVMNILRMGGKFQNNGIDGLVQVAREPGGRASQELWTLPTSPDSYKIPASLEGALASNAGELGRSSNRVSVKVGPGVLGACAVGGQPILLRNAHVDQLFQSSIDEAVVPLPETGRHSAVSASLACVPLLDRTGSVIGVLQAMGDEQTVMTSSQVSTLNLLAQLLSTNLQLIKVNGEQASAVQVSMQRANAAMQQEARQLREDILQKVSS